MYYETPNQLLNWIKLPGCGSLLLLLSDVVAVVVVVVVESWLAVEVEATGDEAQGKDIALEGGGRVRQQRGYRLIEEIVRSWRNNNLITKPYDSWLRFFSYQALPRYQSPKIWNEKCYMLSFKM